ncbi:MAG: SpoIIE family protein phosphatase, partial [Blastocatellia bacterium]
LLWWFVGTVGAQSPAVGDVVVLMSDGLPERFNPQDEMLEDARIQQALPGLAGQSAEQIIAGLVHLGEEWSEGRAQDDDVTFVALKCLTLSKEI